MALEVYVFIFFLCSQGDKNYKDFRSVHYGACTGKETTTTTQTVTTAKILPGKAQPGSIVLPETGICRDGIKLMQVRRYHVASTSLRLHTLILMAISVGTEVPKQTNVIY